MKRTALVSGAAAVIGGGVALALLSTGPGENQPPVSKPVTTTRVSPQPPRRTAPPPIQTPWTTYGRNAARTASAAFTHVHPPYVVRWVLHAKSLIEFPPVISGGTLFFGTNHGRVLAVSGATGRMLWARDFSRCIAASPAVAGRTVYVSVMDPYPCSAGHDPADGFIVALDSTTGKERWRSLVGVTESSPLVVGNTLYVGSWDGRLYALDLHTGNVRWSFRTGGKIKGAAASNGRTVFVGSYDGRVYAIDAATGRPRWTHTLGNSIYANPTISGIGSFWATSEARSGPSGSTTVARSGPPEPAASSTPPARFGVTASTSVRTTDASMQSTRPTGTYVGHSRPAARSRARLQSSPESSTSHAAARASPARRASTRAARSVWPRGAAGCCGRTRMGSTRRSSAMGDTPT